MEARNESCLACRHHPLCVPQCPGQRQSGMEGTAVLGTPAEDLLCPEVRCIGRAGDGEAVLCIPGQTEDFILWVVCVYFSPAMNSFYIRSKNKMVSSSTASVYFGCKHQEPPWAHTCTPMFEQREVTKQHQASLKTKSSWWSFPSLFPTRCHKHS